MYKIWNKISITEANNILGINRFSEDYIKEYNTQEINALLNKDNNIIWVYFINQNKALYNIYHSIIIDEFYNKDIVLSLNKKNIAVRKLDNIKKYYN